MLTTGDIAITRLKTKAIVFSLLLLLLLTIGCSRTSSSCPSGWKENFERECFPEEAFNAYNENYSPPKIPVIQRRKEYSELSAKFSWGQREFFTSSKKNFSRKGKEALASAIDFFNSGDYSSAARAFNESYNEDRNNPETLIFYNNSLAWQEGNRVTLAAVVPGDDDASKSLEILRGVAQAQDAFNTNQKSGGSFLEVIIAKDSKSEEEIATVAEQISTDESVLGVVGHNSSFSSQAALPTYEKNELAMVSPTSTSQYLKSAYFFRTVPSDIETGRALAEYTLNQLGISRVAVFYDDKQESYSKSLKESFTQSFNASGGNVIADDGIKDQDLKSEFKRIVEEQNTRGVLLFPDVTSTSTLIDIARVNDTLSSDMKVQILGGDSLYDDDILSVNANGELDGVVLAVPWFRDTDTAEVFHQEASVKWKGGLSWRTALSFDATQVFLSAIISSQSDGQSVSRQSVFDNLLKVNLSPDETSGKAFEFSDENREPDRESVLVSIEGSKFVLAE